MIRAVNFDPHFQFFTRLAFGKGVHRTITVLALTVGVAVAAIAAHLVAPFISPGLRGFTGDRGILFLAYALAAFTSCLPAARVLELEAAGFFDQIRMCGRPSAALLTQLIAGTLWPHAAVVLALLTANVVIFHGAVGTLAVAAGTGVVALDVSLWIAIQRMRSLPPVAIAEANAVKPLFLWVASVVTAPLFSLRWADGNAYARNEVIIGVSAAALLPLLFWRMARRIDRPIAGRPRWQPRLGATRLARMIPRSGPPEFVRQLRSSTALSGGFGVALWPQLGLLGVAIVERRFALPADTRENLFGAIPILIAAASGILVTAMVRQEMQSGTIDLVRLTAQPPETTALGWYAGIAMPSWIAALLAAATVIAISPTLATRVSFWQLFAAAALVSPAIGLADGLAPRRMETLLALAATTLMTVAAGSLFIRHEPLSNTLPFGMRLTYVIPAGVALVAIGV
ncbi:MAG TPA: hypothetical protein VGY57_15010, partial [Vicinamibacterales bacterium]|nr:hypothetical protein [Vicinamibacterales bacterium]